MIENKVEAAGSSWYVMPNDQCDNNGDGSAPNCASSAGGSGAWKGFSNIVWGGSKIVPGDTLYLIGGKTYNEGTFLAIGASGSYGSPINITVYGSGTAILTGYGFRTNGYNYITIDGLRGDAISGDFDYGIKVTDIPARNSFCYYENNGGGDNNKITHVECYGTDVGNDVVNSQGAIYNASGSPFEASYLWIHGPESGRHSPDLRWNKTGIHSFGVSGGTDFNSNLIHHNKIEFLQMDGMDVGSNTSVYDNDISYTYKSGTHADGIVVQTGSYVKVYNNYLHDDAGQQLLYINNVGNSIQREVYVYNNIFVANPIVTSAVMPIDCEGSGSVIDRVHVTNNTFYGNSAAYIIRATKHVGAGAVTNLTIKNNIFSQGMSPIYSIALQNDTTFLDDNAFDYNVYMYDIGSNIVNWNDSQAKNLTQLKSLSPARELHGKYGIPNFVNYITGDFSLQGNDTIAKNSGTSLSSFYSIDKIGTSRPQGFVWDIGAYEYPESNVVINNEPLVASNGIPTSVLSSNTTSTVLSLNTNISATCRYSTVAGTSYELMSLNFSNTGGVLHSTSVSGLSSGNSYFYFVRCIDSGGQPMLHDYIISFTVASSSGSSSGSSSVGGGSSVVYNNVNMVIEKPSSFNIIKQSNCKPMLKNLFTRSLGVGSKGDDVYHLQKFLNQQGFNVSVSGFGSVGNETNYFGQSTARALKAFQEKYRSEILTPSGLFEGTGFFGTLTRKKVESMLGDGCVQNGIVSNIIEKPTNTLVVYNNVFDKSLVLGDKGDDVKKLQTFLACFPEFYSNPLITGYFGYRTQQALGLFQMTYSIANPQDPGFGFFGPKTRKIVNDLLNTSLKAKCVVI